MSTHFFALLLAFLFRYIIDNSTYSSLNKSSDKEEELDDIIESAIDAAHHHIYHDSDGLDSSNVWGESHSGSAPNVPRDFAGVNTMRIHYYFSGEESLYD